MEKIKSKTERFAFTTTEDLDNIVQSYKYLYVCYLDVVELKKADTGVSIEINKLKELRAFNENAELHITKVGNELLGRYRIDGAGEDIEIFDELQLVWGKPKNSDGNKTKLSEDRGIDVEIPIEIKSNERAFVKVRSYVSGDRFGFDDYRFVDFVSKGVKENVL